MPGVCHRGRHAAGDAGGLPKPARGGCLHRALSREGVGGHGSGGAAAHASVPSLDMPLLDTPKRTKCSPAHEQRSAGEIISSCTLVASYADDESISSAAIVVCVYDSTVAAAAGVPGTRSCARVLRACLGGSG